MSNDRSRGAAAAIHATAEDDSPGREPWYDRLLNILHLKPRDTPRDDLSDALAEAQSGDHAFSPVERVMLKNVLSLHRVRVDDVMIPRSEIVAVPQEIGLGDLLKVFRSAGHSRLPVYGETLDDPRGMVHIRDFVDHLAIRAEEAGPAAGDAGAPAADLLNLGDVDLAAPLSATRILRPVLFVPPSMPAIDLLVRMQASRTHMALVIDEYGGTDGLISIEDLIEVVVGDIEDEHDVAEGHRVLRVEGEEAVFVADARASLAEVAEATGIDLVAEVGEIAEEVDTIGGLVVTIAERVPARGEVIAVPGDFEVEVLDADSRRIKRLRLLHGAARLAEAGDALPPPHAGSEAGLRHDFGATGA
ncbi:hemolysin family protein [Methylobacterium oryzihabitans]|uniref:HlyC/CorC family transporter n=1 Tax=Methylobacterium oryzihabitans TaxID=2499852 RepID=A0A3S2V3D4_9HYPH|nr:hemolysin family protein [Methylobacterium oryzihabitans]RVU13247.1 HlyC/CorC family transporter [Methylobacterium oryzihabitans]